MVPYVWHLLEQAVQPSLAPLPFNARPSVFKETERRRDGQGRRCRETAYNCTSSDSACNFIMLKHTAGMAGRQRVKASIPPNNNKQGMGGNADTQTGSVGGHNKGPTSTHVGWVGA